MGGLEKERGRERGGGKEGGGKEGGRMVEGRKEEGRKVEGRKEERRGGRRRGGEEGKREGIPGRNVVYIAHTNTSIFGVRPYLQLGS